MGSTVVLHRLRTQLNLELNVKTYIDVTKNSEIK